MPLKRVGPTMRSYTLRLTLPGDGDIASVDAAIEALHPIDYTKERTVVPSNHLVHAGGVHDEPKKASVPKELKPVVHDKRSAKALALLLLKVQPNLTGNSMGKFTRWLIKYKATTANPTLHELHTLGLVDRDDTGPELVYFLNGAGERMAEKHRVWLVTQALAKEGKVGVFQGAIQAAMDAIPAVS